MSDAVEIDDDVLRDATHSLHLHFGSLMDLPEELRNTLASVYYEAHWLRRKEGAMPLVAHLPPQKGSEKQLDMAMKQAILRTGQYRIWRSQNCPMPAGRQTPMRDAQYQATATSPTG